VVRHCLHCTGEHSNMHAAQCALDFNWRCWCRLVASAEELLKAQHCPQPKYATRAQKCRLFTSMLSLVINRAHAVEMSRVYA
jgi:hypothetical protein